MSISGMSSYEINPDRPEVHELRGWFESVGKTATVAKISSSGGSGGAKVDRRIVVSQVCDVSCGGVHVFV